MERVSVAEMAASRLNPSVLLLLKNTRTESDLAAMLTIKRLAGVEPDMNLRNSAQYRQETMQARDPP